jgi:hypothetical protein
VEGGEFLGIKCVGEVERCVGVAGEDVTDELPSEVLRPRPCPRVGERRGEDEGDVFESVRWRRDLEAEDFMEEGGESDLTGMEWLAVAPLIGTAADLGGIPRDVLRLSSSAAGLSPANAGGTDTGVDAEAEYSPSNSRPTCAFGTSLDPSCKSGGADIGSAAASAPPSTGVGWRPSRRALEMSAALHLA